MFILHGLYEETKEKCFNIHVLCTLGLGVPGRSFDPAELSDSDDEDPDVFITQAPPDYAAVVNQPPNIELVICCVDQCCYCGHCYQIYYRVLYGQT